MEGAEVNGKPWLPADTEYIRKNYPDRPTKEIAAALGRSELSVYNQAQILKISKSEAYMAGPQACRLRRGDNVGKSFRFTAGHVPANKGLRRPGYSPGRMKETQFRKGERKGIAIKLYKPIGTERTSKDGYLERKINDDMPLQKRWRAVHLIVWEEVNGPLPKGHAVAFKNGKKDDVRLDNLVLVTRAELMRRNTIHNYPIEIVDAVRAVTSLTRAIKKEKNVEANSR